MQTSSLKSSASWIDATCMHSKDPIFILVVQGILFSGACILYEGKQIIQKNGRF